MTKRKEGPHEPTGRPTKYDPKYCAMLIEHMSKGLSYETFSAVIDTAIATLYNWEKDFPQFLEAKNSAFAKNLLFWEQKGIDGLENITEYNSDGSPITKKSMNAAVWVFNMKNRHRWKDKHEEPIDPNAQKENLPQIVVMLPDNGTSSKENKPEKKPSPKPKPKGKKNGGKL